MLIISCFLLVCLSINATASLQRNVAFGGSCSQPFVNLGDSEMYLDFGIFEVRRLADVSLSGPYPYNYGENPAWATFSYLPYNAYSNNRYIFRFVLTDPLSLNQTSFATGWFKSDEYMGTVSGIVYNKDTITRMLVNLHGESPNTSKYITGFADIVIHRGGWPSPHHCMMNASIIEWDDSVWQGNLSLMQSLIDTGLQEQSNKITQLENRVNSIENSNGTSTSPNYLMYLSQADRKKMVCGYIGANNMTNYSDLGLKCTLIKKYSRAGTLLSTKCDCV